MSTLFLILVLAAEEPANRAKGSTVSAQADRASAGEASTGVTGSPQTQSDKAPSKPRKHHELSKEVSRLLQAEVRSTSAAERAELVHQMCALFTEVVQDPRFSKSESLEDMRARLAGRLRKIQKEISKELAGSTKQKGQRRSKPAADRAQNAAGQRTAVAQAAEAPGGATQGGAAPASTELRDATESLATQLALVGATMGGPASLLSRPGGAFGGGRRDDGEALVELIQRTIHPDFWDVNGGPGTIIYYAPLHALVVRATDEIHGDVGGLARGLRAVDGR